MEIRMEIDLFVFVVGQLAEEAPHEQMLVIVRDTRWKETTSGTAVRVFIPPPSYLDLLGRANSLLRRLSDDPTDVLIVEKVS